MGTSASNKGPGSKSPLVPPWADATPGEPIPEPTGHRFRGFRTEIGKAIAGAGGGSWKEAVRRYSREATQGASVGPRRFGPAYTAGAQLIGLVSELGAGGTGQDATGFDLRSLIGQPIDVAAQEIARILAPKNADADMIAVAIQEALAEALPEAETFEPSFISSDQMIQLLVEFFSRILFQEILTCAGDAWNHSPNAERTTKAENELLEIVRAAVDQHFSPHIGDAVAGMRRDEIETLERLAMEDIWREWERQE